MSQVDSSSNPPVLDADVNVDVSEINELPVEPGLLIESLDLEGRGVGRHEGKVIFVEGALPGERVLYSAVRRKPSYEIAKVTQVLKSSSIRVQPKCPSFGNCGGCLMQHVDAGAQVAIKQRVLEDALTHIGKIPVPRMLGPIHGPTWGYRFRARLSVRLVTKKGGVLVGFHERKRSYIADMKECHVLPKHVSDLLVPLRELFSAMSAPDKLAQLEVAVGDETTVLALRHLVPLTDSDQALMLAFARQHNVCWWTQAKGPDTLQPLLIEDENRLAYTLPEFGLRMAYKPSDFTQVNHAINRVLISRALSLLAPLETDRVADLFCGLGNFTLPLASRCKEVVGVEGSEVLTQRAIAAAREHGLDHKTQFSTLNLFDIDAAWLESLGAVDKMLIDPPREGALAVATALVETTQPVPERIVYVSCNPATLARDAAVLVGTGRYELSAAGVINMFPHTGHVESIAVFEKKPN